MTTPAEKATAGPWRVQPVKGYCMDYIVTDHPDYQQKPHGNYVGETGLGAGQKEQRFSADAHLIVTAVNACFALNPSDPLRAAEAIREAFEMLEEASPPFVYGSGPYNEWNHRRERLLSRLQGGTGE